MLTLIPVCRLLQDLIETDSECFVLVAFLDEILVNPELCCCDGLSLWDTGKVETKFLAVLLVQKILILLHYQKKTDRWGDRVRQLNIKANGFLSDRS